MKRKKGLDDLRIAAAFAVVIFHVMGSSVHNDPAVPAELAQALTRCKAMLQWPVPVFFMITGFLWLRPEKECTFSKVLPGGEASKRNPPSIMIQRLKRNLEICKMNGLIKSCSCKKKRKTANNLISLLVNQVCISL